MRVKKTLTERLTAKHQLVIRSDEDLSEKSSYSFTYARFLIVLMLFFFVSTFCGIFLTKTVLAKWFDPSYAQATVKRKIYEMTLQMDSLHLAMDDKDRFIENIQYLLSGDTTLDSLEFSSAQIPVTSVTSRDMEPRDMEFRKNFEKSEAPFIGLSYGSSYRLSQGTFFFPPVTGVISQTYNPRRGMYGIEITSRTNESVKAIANGTVIMSMWAQDFGYVLAIQHEDNIVSIYKHNAEILVKMGSFVTVGTIVAIAGDKREGEGSSPRLYFELWQSGHSLNPEEYISF